ncbi:hypothetical protein [Microbacterium kunmingense]|uniref:hypothetical protein n=1 Tax=Microbacterium kunmingense TaxID=2915939 RepID=UPI003D71B443
MAVTATSTVCDPVKVSTAEASPVMAPSSAKAAVPKAAPARSAPPIASAVNARFFN